MKLITLLNLFPSDVWGTELLDSHSFEEISAYENKFGLIFPSDFKEYLHAYNGLSFPFEYIFSIKRNESPYLFDIQGTRLSLVKEGIISNDFIPFCFDGFGGVFAFRNGSSEVFLVVNGEVNFLHKSFSDWLLSRLYIAAETEGIELPVNVTIEFN